MTDKILRGFMKVYKLSMSIRSATFTQPFIGNLIFRKRHIRRMTTLATGINLINIPWITRARCEDGITAPDPSTLTTEVLLRNASFAVVEATTAFLSQVTISLAESYQQYTKALFVLIKLMEYRLKVLDNEESEQKISDLIIEARASVNKFKNRNQELQLLYMSAYNLVTESSTAAYSAGSEFHSTIATSVTQSSELHLSSYRNELSDAESKLREMEAKVIRVESEHAEKQQSQSSEQIPDSPETDINNSDLDSQVKQLDLSNLDDDSV